MMRLEISGMTCDGCARSVTRAVQAVPGVSQVAVDLADATVTVEGGAPDAIRAAIERAGHAVVQAGS
ncbi:heavy metal-associated domain-containing protein, partial [Staphylococcus gallinarum]|uniref:heavy-metal-associated domain-containing protein n=1 Tax=Staphylococcus gallinarum TaxID=1293 RepID=UPI00317CF200